MQEPQLARSDRLSKRFFARTPQRVAPELLGKTIVRQLPSGEILRGVIVETEAYLASDDPASHSARGLTRKNRSMFRAGGTLYVYAIHSRHCMNVVTQRENVGSAVLIRAVEPLEGWFRMAAARGVQQAPTNSTRWASWARQLTTGPGRLCQALDVCRLLDGVDLTTSDQVWIEDTPSELRAVRWATRRGPRIGITRAQELALRYFIDGHRCVSGCARDHTRGRHWTFYECLLSTRPCEH
ncbi:MAG: putative 3-methyladenine DNA glycosylase [Pirellulaceae bacterium]|nr:MAG: putative 3-methyladenine DNA glycosylase [Pirellulaceae bacterium]